MPKCALPDHLKNLRHTDWPWPLSYLPRSINAFGPRCGRGSDGYKPWPPRLIKGKGVSRWETSGAKSIIHIPMLDNATIGPEIYGRTFRVFENGKEKIVRLEWRELTWPFTEEEANIYFPSTIQSYSPQGYMTMEPWYKSSWNQGMYFVRMGYRNDALDIYYNYGPYAGVNFE